MKKKDLLSLLSRAIGAIVNPKDLAPEEVNHVVQDLEYAEKLVRLGPALDIGKPKTVHLIIDGIDSEPLVHDNRYMTLTLIDELEARGGQVFYFNQKVPGNDMTEAARLMDHVKDEHRHPDTQFIYVTRIKKADEHTPAVDSPVTQALKYLQSKVPEDCVNVFRFQPGTPDAHISTIVYQTLYLALTSVRGITPPPTVNQDVVTELRNQLLHANNALRAVGMAVNMVGQPQAWQPWYGNQMGPGMNYQGFGRSARPFTPRPYPYGQPPFRHMQTAGHYPPVMGDFDGDETNVFRSMGGGTSWLSEQQVATMTDSLKHFGGALVVHLVGRDPQDAVVLTKPFADLVPEAEVEVHCYSVDDADIAATVKANLAKVTNPAQIHVILTPATWRTDNHNAVKASQLGYAIRGHVSMNHWAVNSVQDDQLADVNNLISCLYNLLALEASRDSRKF